MDTSLFHVSSSMQGAHWTKRSPGYFPVLTFIPGGTGRCPWHTREHFLLGPSGRGSAMCQGVVPGAIFRDWHLQAGCFSSGLAQPASPADQSDPEANEHIHLQIARVVQRLNLLSFQLSPAFNPPLLPPEGDIVATKNRMSMAEVEILRTGPMAGVDVLNRRR